MQSTQYINTLIEHLEVVKLRPYMYVSNHRDAIDNFLAGFFVACSAFGIEFHRYEHVIRDVLRQRGWTFTTESLTTQMLDREMHEEKVYNEVLTIYIEVLKQIHKSNQ